MYSLPVYLRVVYSLLVYLRVVDSLPGIPQGVYSLPGIPQGVYSLPGIPQGVYDASLRTSGCVPCLPTYLRVYIASLVYHRVYIAFRYTSGVIPQGVLYLRVYNSGVYTGCERCVQQWCIPGKRERDNEARLITIPHERGTTRRVLSLLFSRFTVGQ